MTTNHPSVEPVANTDTLPTVLPVEPKETENHTKLAPPEQPPKLEEMYYHFALARS